MKYTELRSGTSVRWFMMQISIWLELGFRSQFRYEMVSRIIADSRPCNSSNPETFIEVLVMCGLSSCSTLCSFRRWFESAKFRFRILKQSELRVFFPLMRSRKVLSLVCWDIGFAFCHRSMRSRTSEWWRCSGIWKQAIEFLKWGTGACAWTISRTYCFFPPIWKTRPLLVYECLV